MLFLILILQVRKLKHVEAKKPAQVFNSINSVASIQIGNLASKYILNGFFTEIFFLVGIFLSIRLKLLKTFVLMNVVS